MGTDLYTDVQLHSSDCESSLRSSLRIISGIKREFLLLAVLQRWPQMTIPGQSYSLLKPPELGTLHVATSPHFWPVSLFSEDIFICDSSLTASNCIHQRILTKQADSNTGAYFVSEQYDSDPSLNFLNISTFLYGNGNGLLPTEAAMKIKIICYSWMHSPMPTT